MNKEISLLARASVTKKIDNFIQLKVNKIVVWHDVQRLKTKNGEYFHFTHYDKHEVYPCASTR